MPFAKLPILTKLNRSTSGESNIQSLQDFKNGVLIPDDSGGYISKKRAGIRRFANIGTNERIDGIYWWALRRSLIVVSNGNVYAITDQQGNFRQIPGVKLEIGRNVSFAEAAINGVVHLFMANSGSISYTDGISFVNEITDAEAPTNCNHIAFIDYYLVAINEDGGQFFYSEIGNPLSWSALDFVTAESDFDNSVAMIVRNRNVILFGERTIEYWRNDGTTPFSRRGDIQKSRGTLSPDSVVDTNYGVFFLSNTREVFRMDNIGNYTKVSQPIENILNSIEDVTDVVASNHFYGLQGFYVMKFRSSNRTFAYDYINDYWCEWTHWNNSVQEDYLGSHFSTANEWNLDFVGSDNGFIYTSSFDNPMDLDNHIRWSVLTGHIDHGERSLRKKTRSIDITITGDHTLSEQRQPNLMFRRRRNNDKWSNIFNIEFGSKGDDRLFKKVYMPAHYRSMQYEFFVTDDLDFEIIDISEDYIILGD